MARPLRIQFEGAWYHVMNRGATRRDIFTDDDERQVFVDLIGALFERFGVETHAYCLMDNHYHLLLHTPEANLSRAMRHLHGVYTQYHNRKTGEDGSLFRGRYHAIIVDADAYLLQVSRYIHRNPLEAGLGAKLSRYPWSSYPAYIGAAGAPAWLHRGEVLAAFGASPRRYRGFVEDPDAADASPAIESGQAILGDETFRDRVLDRFEGDVREVPALRQRGADLPAPTAIVSAAAAALEVAPDAPYRSVRRVPNESRLLAMYLCQSVGRMTLDEIRALFGLGHYGSVASALARYRRLRAERPDLQAAESTAQTLMTENKT